LPRQNGGKPKFKRKMAKKKDYYMKFNFKDFNSDPKVLKCDPATVGIYIRVICLLCDSKEKGRYELSYKFQRDFAEVLPRQNVQQSSQQMVRHMPNICRALADEFGRLFAYKNEVLFAAFEELLENEVLYLEGDCICQKRMIRDAEISNMRSGSGKKGAAATNNKKKKPIKNREISEENFAGDFAAAKVQQKPNYNYISVTSIGTDIGEEKKGKEGIGNVRGVQGDENLGEKEKGETPENNLPPQNLNFNLHEQKKKSTKVLTLDAGDVQLLANLGENVRIEWLAWRQYLLDVHNKKTDNIQVKQQQLEKLVMFSKGDEDLAVKIIKNSIGNVWANLQPISTSKFPQNGAVKPPMSDIDQRIAAEKDPKKLAELQREKYALP
jgi:hypothetical protein